MIPTALMRRLVTAAMLVTLVGCASVTVRSAAPDSDVVPEPPPGLLDQTHFVTFLLTCGEGDNFPITALDGAGGAEQGADPVAAALRAVLADSGDPSLPTSGWYRVSLSATHAQFVAHGQGDERWVVVALDNGPGGWTMDLAGACRLAPVLGRGVSPASWWLDPRAPAPSAPGWEVAALVHETCGKSTEGRVVAPLVAYRPDAIVVAFGVRPPPGGGGDAICVDSPPSKYRLVLDEPIAGRRLLDGSVVPPREATDPPE
jgi:hypothetical protein